MSGNLSPALTPWGGGLCPRIPLIPDFMALGAREYGANFGIWGRLLDVLDKHGVKATVITSGLMAELFPKRS